MNLSRRPWVSERLTVVSKPIDHAFVNSSLIITCLRTTSDVTFLCMQIVFLHSVDTVREFTHHIIVLKL